MTDARKTAVQIIRRNVDEAAILAALVKLKLQQHTAFSESDEIVRLKAQMKSRWDYRLTVLG